MCQHRIECSNGIIGRIGNLGVVVLYNVRTVAHRANEDSFGQTALRLYLAEKGIVYHEIKERAEVGHITVKHLIRVYGYIQTAEIDTEIGRKKFGYIRVFITFHTFRGESVCLKMTESLIADGIHGFG